MTKFHFDITQDSKITKTQKSKFLENEALAFLQIKNSLITYQGPLKKKKSVVAEVIFSKCGKSIWHDQFVLGRYPKLGLQTRITIAVAIVKLQDL